MREYTSYEITEEHYLRILNDGDFPIRKHKVIRNDREKITLSLLSRTNGEELFEHLEEGAELNMEYVTYSYDIFLIKSEYTPNGSTEYYAFSTYDTANFHFFARLLEDSLRYLRKTKGIENPICSKIILYDDFNSFPLDNAVRVIASKDEGDDEDDVIIKFDISIEEPCDSSEFKYSRFLFNENIAEGYIELSKEFYGKKIEKAKKSI